MLWVACSINQRITRRAACYQDSLDSGPCSEAGTYPKNSATLRLLLTFHFYEAVPYQVTMTNGNFTHTIVQPIWTIGLVVQAFGGLFQNHSKMTL